MVMESPPSPQSVGREFVRQYYTLLNQAPLHLHRFYNNQSSLVHGGLDPPNRETSPVIGQKQIHQKIQQLNFCDCHAKITQVDSQATLGDGVVVQVTGELSNAGQPMRRFTQTFVLAAQSPKKYYVHNDIFRYQDEIISDDEEVDADVRSEHEDDAGQSDCGQTSIISPITSHIVPTPDTSSTLSSVTNMQYYNSINQPIAQAHVPVATTAPTLISNSNNGAIIQNMPTSQHINASGQPTAIGGHPGSSQMAGLSVGVTTMMPQVNGIAHGDEISITSGIANSPSANALTSPSLSHNASGQMLSQSLQSSTVITIPIDESETLSNQGLPIINNSDVNVQPLPISTNSSNYNEQLKPQQSVPHISGVLTAEHTTVSNEPKTYANSLKSGGTTVSYSNQNPQPIVNVPLQTQTARPISPPFPPVRENQYVSGRNNYNRTSRPINNTGQTVPSMQQQPSTMQSSRSNRQSGDGRSYSNRPQFTENEQDERRQRQQNNFSDTNQLFLGSLPLTATEDDIRKIFGKFGNIVKLSLINKQNKGSTVSNRTTNIAFLTYETHDQLENCLNNKPIHYRSEDTDVSLVVEERKRDRGTFGHDGGTNTVSMGGGDRRNDHRYNRDVMNGNNGIGNRRLGANNGTPISMNRATNIPNNTGNTFNNPGVNGGNTPASGIQPNRTSGYSRNNTASGRSTNNGSSTGYNRR